MTTNPPDESTPNETGTDETGTDETGPDESLTRELPTVVIIGRPNVGKSTLFNRIVGSQQAIVEDRPGITRDRKELEAEWLDIPFLVVDTGGWMPGGDELETKVSRQVEAAVREADVVLFVVDASVGLTDDDQTIANWIRRSGTQVIVVANKADNERRETEMWEFMSLGIGEPVPVSALHGRRAGDLLDAVLERFPEHLRVPASKPIDPWAPGNDDDDRCRRGVGPARGDRRSTERGQEHAVQPVGGGGPSGRPRPRGHDAGLDRHDGGHRRRTDRVHRHRRDAPQGQDRRLRGVLLLRACVAVDRRRRCGPARDRCHRRRHGAGSAARGSGSTPQGVRSC